MSFSTLVVLVGLLGGPDDVLRLRQRGEFKDFAACQSELVAATEREPRMRFYCQPVYVGDPAQPQPQPVVTKSVAPHVPSAAVLKEVSRIVRPTRSRHPRNRGRGRRNRG